MDVNHHVRFVAAFYSQFEDTECYTFGFEILKETLDAVLEISDRYYAAEYDLNFLIADGAESIFNACKYVWPNAVQVMDIFHLGKAIASHLNSDGLNQKQKEEIKTELDNLVACTEEAEFKTLKRLTLNKWEEKCPNFAQYFEGQWLNGTHDI